VEEGGQWWEREKEWEIDVVRELET